MLVTNYFENLLNCLNLIIRISLPCGFKKYTEEKLALTLQHRRFGRAEGLDKLCPWEQKPAVKILSQSQKQCPGFLVTYLLATQEVHKMACFVWLLVSQYSSPKNDNSLVQSLYGLLSTMAHKRRQFEECSRCS